jgi:selenocysteine-specific elongation factor
LGQQALRFLIAVGEVTDISPEIALATEAYQAAVSRIRAHLQAHGQATVSELKGVLACSRRVMVPLLERLDRDGVTRRNGDLRTLR